MNKQTNIHHKSSDAMIHFLLIQYLRELCLHNYDISIVQYIVVHGSKTMLFNNTLYSQDKYHCPFITGTSMQHCYLLTHTGITSA